MKDVSTTWEKPITLSNVQPKLTPGMIQAAESQIGYRLPAANIDLMYLLNRENIRCANEKYNHHTRIFGIGPNQGAITNNEFLTTASLSRILKNQINCTLYTITKSRQALNRTRTI